MAQKSSIKSCAYIEVILTICLDCGYRNIQHLMVRLLVSLKKSLCRCLIFTLDTWIFDTFMFILFVCLKLVLSCCLIFTLLNGIFNTFMFGLFVKFKITLLCFLLSTLVTRISLLLCFALLWTIKQDFILNMEAHRGHWASVTFVIKNYFE